MQQKKYSTKFQMQAFTLSCVITFFKVGDSRKDHGYWGRPEDMTLDRPTKKLTPTNPGSDLAADVAAAMAAGSMAFAESGKL